MYALGPAGSTSPALKLDVLYHPRSWKTNIYQKYIPLAPERRVGVDEMVDTALPGACEIQN